MTPPARTPVGVPLNAASGPHVWRFHFANRTAHFRLVKLGARLLPMAGRESYSVLARCASAWGSERPFHPSPRLGPAGTGPRSSARSSAVSQVSIEHKLRVKDSSDRGVSWMPPAASPPGREQPLTFDLDHSEPPSTRWPTTALCGGRWALEGCRPGVVRQGPSPPAAVKAAVKATRRPGKRQAMLIT